MRATIANQCGCTAGKVFWLWPPAGKIERVGLIGFPQGENPRMHDLFVFYMEMIEEGCFLEKQNDLDQLLEAFEMNGRLTPDQCQHLYHMSRKYPMPNTAPIPPSRKLGSIF